VLAFANALPGGVAFNFALGRLASETTVASARSRDTVGFGARYFDLSPTMDPFEYDDPGRSGIYPKTEARKGHHEDNGFPHLGLVAQAKRLIVGWLPVAAWPTLAP
jgi:hypothetical protein